jgi:uncharacterized repeat protein (TIGR03803 family)
VLTGNGGMLYGTTANGGEFGYGVVYDLVPDTVGSTENVIYSFDRPGVPGPGANVVQDKLGDLFGAGVFELMAGTGGWTARSICTTGGCQGTNALSRLSITPGVILYGTSHADGEHLVGAVYAVANTPKGWQERDLYDFGGWEFDGQTPSYGQVAVDREGTIYGSTFAGGRNICGNGGCGTVYRLSRGSNGQWGETILYNFKETGTGNNPVGGVILDKAGNLYGATGYGGAACSCGVVYRLHPDKNGTWSYTVLHQFVNTDGALPSANLTIGPDGSLYGTTVGSGPTAEAWYSKSQGRAMDRGSSGTFKAIGAKYPPSCFTNPQLLLKLPTGSGR